MFFNFYLTIIILVNYTISLDNSQIFKIFHNSSPPWTKESPCEYNEKFNNDVKLIEEKFNSLNIKFKTQFSDHRHCLRFLISQSEENLNIIKNI